MLPGQLYHSISFDRLKETEGEFKYPTEYLNSLQFPGFPPHDLLMKIGAPMMLTMTIDPSNGLCNGTRIIPLEISANVVKARVLDGTNRTVFIPK